MLTTSTRSGIGTNVRKTRAASSSPRATGSSCGTVWTVATGPPPSELGASAAGPSSPPQADGTATTTVRARGFVGPTAPPSPVPVRTAMLAGSGGSFPLPGAAVDGLPCGALDEGEQRRSRPADVERLVGGWAMRPPGDGLVFGVHLVPGVAARRGGAAVVLVERPLAEEHDQLDAIEGARPAVEVVVHEPAAGQGEAFVKPTELVPDRAETEQAAALARRAEQAPPPGAGRRADVEQLVTVGLPVRLGEQPILRRLVVAHLAGAHVAHGTQMERRCGYDRPGGEAGAVDDEAHEVALRHLQAMVRGPGGRRGCRVNPLQPQAALETCRQPAIDGWCRPVVDDDHLVVIGGQPPLVTRAERPQRPWELAGHVMGDHHDAQGRQPGRWAHGAER